MDKWIKCKDRMPEIDEECLVASCIRYGYPEYGFSIYLARFRDHKFYSWELDKKLNHVTHWMPLPDSPDSLTSHEKG